VKVKVADLNCSLSLPFLSFVSLLHMHASQSDLSIVTSRYSQLPAIDSYHSCPQSKRDKARNNQNTLPRPVDKMGYTKPPPNSLSTHLKTLPFQSLQSPPQGSREYGFIPKRSPCVQSYYVGESTELGGPTEGRRWLSLSSFNRTSHQHHQHQHNTNDHKQWVSLSHYAYMHGILICV